MKGTKLRCQNPALKNLGASSVEASRSAAARSCQRRRQRGSRGAARETNRRRLRPTLSVSWATDKRAATGRGELSGPPAKRAVEQARSGGRDELSGRAMDISASSGGPPCGYVRSDICCSVSPKDKPLVWLSGEVKTPPFSSEARVEAGFLLRQLQAGAVLAMPHSRPMPSIGPRCHELRIQDSDKTWRIIYRIDHDAIIIADVFVKKSRTTPKLAIETSRRRLRQYDESRQGRTLMDKAKRKRIEKSGWKVGSASAFLELTPVEAQLVEMKVALSARLRKTRERRHLSQTELAERMGSSQSRVAKMEAGDPSVSIDLLVHGLLAAGASRREIASALTPRKKASA